MDHARRKGGAVSGDICTFGGFQGLREFLWCNFREALRSVPKRKKKSVFTESSVELRVSCSPLTRNTGVTAQQESPH